jgi:hypothetical protein
VRSVLQIKKVRPSATSAHALLKGRLTSFSFGGVPVISDHHAEMRRLMPTKRNGILRM